MSKKEIRFWIIVFVLVVIFVFWALLRPQWVKGQAIDETVAVPLADCNFGWNRALWVDQRYISQETGVVNIISYVKATLPEGVTRCTVTYTLTGDLIDLAIGENDFIACTYTENPLTWTCVITLNQNDTVEQEYYFAYKIPTSGSLEWPSVYTHTALGQSQTWEYWPYVAFIARISNFVFGSP
jgi:hypothetical protein